MRISNYESKVASFNELPAVQIKVASSNASGLAICFQYNNRSTRIMFSNLVNRLVIISIGRETGYTVERIDVVGKVAFFVSEKRYFSFILMVFCLGWL